MDGIIMSKKELKTYRLTMNVLEGKLSITELSTLLDKSYRQTQRIVKKVKEKAELGVIHGNTGRTPWNKTSEDLIDQIMSLLRGKYHDFNLAHFQEFLEEQENIKINYSTLYRNANKRNLIKQKKRRSKRKFSTRARLPKEGMMVQFDGSEHLWFGNFKSDLIAGIDDATGKILGAEFFIGETSFHSMEVIKGIVRKYGIPESFYVDEAAIYGKLEKDWDTQIKRALKELNSKLLIATSAQAKGRVERLFRTLQDRLIAELSLLDIKTIPEANKYLNEIFIPKFNKKFTIKAREKENSYQKLSDWMNLDLILCKREHRKITSGNTFSYQGSTYIIKGNKDWRFRKMNISTNIHQEMKFDIMGKIVSVEIFKKKKDKIKEEVQQAA